MADVFRIKRRYTGGAAGAPTTLANGELAYNEVDDKLYYGKGNNAGQATSIIPIAGPGMGYSTGGGSSLVSTDDVAPSTPSDGTLWWDSASGQLFIYYSDGTSNQWISTSNLPAGVAGGPFLALSGGTLTGLLTLSGAPTSNLHATTKLYVDNADNLRLLLTGGTLSGSLGISATSPYLALTKAASGNTAFIVSGTGAFTRWLMYLGDNAAESGSNVGSNFAIWRYNDAGTPLDASLTITRSTGEAVFSKHVYANGTITSQGASAGLVFNQQDAVRAWQWYSSGVNSNARLWNGSTGDVFTIDTGGNAVINGILQVGLPSNGQVRLQNGGAGNAGYLGIHRPDGTRLCYFGYYTDAPSLTIEVGGVFKVVGGNLLITAGNLDLGSSFFVGRQGVNAYLSMGPNYYWLYDTASGNMTWSLNGTIFWFMRNDLLCYNQIGSVGGYGPYNNYSDRRMKEDIEPATEGLAEILKLNPVKFYRKKPKVAPATAVRLQELGFIAQEVRPILPQAVRVGGIELQDGTGGLSDIDPTLALTYDSITTALVNAVKELYAEIEALKAAK